MISIRSRMGALLLATLAGNALAQDKTPSEAVVARSLAATCANCHGTQGIAKGEMKSLAGRKEDELLKLMAEFRSGAQPATVMHQITKGYTDAQLKLIARHFAALPSTKP